METNNQPKPKEHSTKLPPKPVPPRHISKPIQKQTLDVMGAKDVTNQTLHKETVVSVNKTNKVSESTPHIDSKPSSKNTKSTSQKNKRGKKPLIISLIVAICLMVIGGGIAGYIITDKENNRKLETPVLEVVQLFNGTVLETNALKGATKYEFLVTDGTGNSNTFTSLTNTLELNKYLKQAGDFSVKARALGKGKGATSDYSDVVSFTNYITLDAPVIHIGNMDKILDRGKVIGYKNNTDLTDDVVSWDAIKNASKYYVRYGVDLTNNTVKYEEVPATLGVVSFSLSNIYKYGTGKYQISVVAVPEAGSYYLQSGYQEIISIEYFAKQPAVSDAEYNKETKTLTFKLPETASDSLELDLFVTYATSTKHHKIYLNDTIKTVSGGYINVSCNLQQIAVGDIISMTIVTLSDGVYSTNSDAATVEIK